MISQRINLYKIQGGSGPDLSFLKILEIYGVFLVILFLYSLIVWGLAHAQSKNADHIKEEKAVIESQLIEKNAGFNVEEQQKKLQSEINKLTSDRDQRKSFLGALKTQGFNQQQGFSRFLEGLAQNHVEGVWITKMIFLMGGTNIALSGTALRAKLIPLFFQELSKDVNYKGKAFQKMMIQKDTVSAEKKNSNKADKSVATAAPTKVNEEQVSFEAQTEAQADAKTGGAK